MDKRARAAARAMTARGWAGVTARMGWGYGETGWGYGETGWGYGETGWGYGETGWGYGETGSPPRQTRRGVRP